MVSVLTAQRWTKRWPPPVRKAARRRGKLPRSKALGSGPLDDNSRFDADPTKAGSKFRKRAPNLILSKNLLARVLQNYAIEFSLLLASKRIVPVVDISRALSFPVATVVEPKRKPPTQAALLHS